MNPKKKRNPIQTIFKLEVSGFQVRIAEAKIEIESKDKTWKQVYAAGTIAYDTSINIAKQKRYDALESLCIGLKGTEMFYVKPELLVKFIDLLKKSKENDTLEETV